jgi:outer membrane protein assembly factor BamB
VEISGVKFSPVRLLGSVVPLSFGAALLFTSVNSFGDVNVTQYHNDARRDGLYIDPAFTPSAAANLKRDTNFNGTISGSVYAQPLYIEGGPGGRALVIAVTESNNVYALDAATGQIVWQCKAGVPVSSGLPCGDIGPLGITGTPVVDLATRTLFFDAMTTPDGGTTFRHLIYALDVDTGTTNSGWPVDVNATAKFGTNTFTSISQNQRSALGLFDGYVYAAYSGLAGDCSTYHGWIVGLQENDPSSVLAWCTTANRGGSWGVGGVATDDGTHPFIATGNTFGASSWGGGEAVIRFQPGPVFSGLTNDYWAATNWASLDSGDLDIGGCGPLIVDVPGATPSQLVVALGKDGNAYLLNRTNLGGITVPVAQQHMTSQQIRQAAVTYRTALGTYVAFGTDAGKQIIAFRITPTSPPTIQSVWTNSYNGRGSPFATSTDSSNNVIVWVVGNEGDQQLHGFNGDTGAVVYSGGGPNELMSGTHRFSTAIAARGRIYVANDNRVFAFTIPVPPIVLTNPVVLPDGTFQFGFTNIPGLSFTVRGTTNLALPFTNWALLGNAIEISPGQFQFTSASAGYPLQFYRVTTP